MEKNIAVKLRECRRNIKYLKMEVMGFMNAKCVFIFVIGIIVFAIGCMFIGIGCYKFIAKNPQACLWDESRFSM